MNTLCDRTSATQGELVTTLELDEEITTNLTAKNWIVKKLVAQYKYDANTYEDLIPEFNIEFSSDKYEICDSVSEIVIDNMVWENGIINEHNGQNATSNTTSALRTKYYYSVIPDITYNLKFWTHCFWYDKDKNFISHEMTGDSNEKVIAPNNAKYVRLHRGSGSANDAYNMVVSAKLITRSIESVNGDLPTLMRFGLNADVAFDNYSNKELCLLRVNAINTKKLSTAEALFRQCRRMVCCNTTDINTSNISSFASAFQDCQSLTSLDVSNWDTSKVTNMNQLFNMCHKLTRLDLSKWNTSKVTDMDYMFDNTYNLRYLDISNFDTSSLTSTNRLFQSDSCNIGMLYCSPSTINTICSYIIATNPTTVWVEGSMIDELTSYNNITYEAYYYEKELLLNSPLLEGDKIVKMNGKMYHWHKMGMITFDGSEGWRYGKVDSWTHGAFITYIEDAYNNSDSATSGLIYCDFYKKHLFFSYIHYQKNIDSLNSIG